MQYLKIGNTTETHKLKSTLKFKQNVAHSMGFWEARSNIRDSFELLNLVNIMKKQAKFSEIIVAFSEKCVEQTYSNFIAFHVKQNNIGCLK